MKKFFKLFKTVKKHKLISLFVVLLLMGGVNFAYNKFFGARATIKYVTTKVEKGPLITSISGTGQISASNQIDLKAKASGSIVYLNALAGQEVKAGTVLARLDSRDAYKSVRDAQANLESAKLSMTKLTQPADDLTILQAENSLAAAKENKQQAEINLQKSYDDGFNSVSDAFLNLPSVMSGLKDLLYSYNFSDNSSNLDWYFNQGISLNYQNTEIYNKVVLYRDKVTSSYAAAREKYDSTFDYYKTVSRDSDSATIENLISQTYEATKLISTAVQNTNNYLDLVQDLMQNYSNAITIPSIMTTHQNSLDTFTSKTNSHLTSLLSITNTISNSKNSLVTSDRSIAEKTESLAKLKAGADPLDIQSQQLSLKQKENALLDVQEKLADYTVVAPFGGVVGKVSVKKNDDVSSGTSVVTFITKQQTSSIALNEVDIAKVKVGQKVTLTFDAIDGLTITGEVAEVDALGTVSQGVVSYNVKIVFDVQDDRVKSGMSTSANIILDSKPDVLMVPSGAIKSQGGSNYVEVLVNNLPQTKNVEIGSSNDTMTEITKGLDEGEEVITQKITVTGGTTTSGVSASNTNSSARGQAGSQQNMFRMMRTD